MTPVTDAAPSIQAAFHFVGPENDAFGDELGRVIRTITLLRFIAEPELREEITAATNKVEAYNGFSAWLRFGHDAIERNCA